MKRRIVDIICLVLVLVLFGSVALLNAFQPNRPTTSETEQRELTKMPVFSWSSLADGSYFSELSLYISDTFLFRDQLVGISKEMDTLKGLDYSLGDENSFVILDPTAGVGREETDANVGDRFQEAFDNLLNQEEATDEPAVEPGESETPPAPDTAEPETDPDPVEPETNEPETDPESESEVETDAPATESKETEPAPSDTGDGSVTALYLSRDTLRLTVGSGYVVYATVDSTSTEGATVRWSVSDSSIASISKNAAGGIDVKANKAGTCTLTCTYSDAIKATCQITVTEVGVTGAPSDAGNADFLTNGMFIYGEAVYTQGFYSPANAGYFAQTAQYYQKLFGKDTRVSTVVIPVSSMVVDRPEITSKIPNQKDILRNMQSLMDPSVNFVNVYEEMYAHRDEYLFFKSDHHWTQRGAYYAYRAFANSVGLKPTPLDDFDFSIGNDQYQGSLYNYTYDARVKEFIDTIEVFRSRKAHTMTVTNMNGGTNVYDTSIVNFNKTYVTFIAGDNPYTVINVPENPQDKTILVLKDSFGNAFVPFLCEHYGNIFVVDVRHTTMNVYEHFKDYGLTDIVFVNNIQAANTYDWSRRYMAAVGVALN